MLTRGVEPPRPLSHTPLKRARLPIPPREREKREVNIGGDQEKVIIRIEDDY